MYSPFLLFFLLNKIYDSLIALVCLCMNKSKEHQVDREYS